jgi:glycosyltransferase involved in cell wall biosynthesis
MISEAMACGTPVAAFEMGSAYDLVNSGITGYRSELKNAEDLSQGIKRS